MKLPVHRIIPFSNVEGYGNRTSIFVQGCNANCLYCHNSETIPMTSKDAKLYSVDELLVLIKNQIPFIRGITVSGGEATLYHKFITKLFIEVKKLGLTCYIDTNGFFDYEKIKDLIEVTDKFLFDVKSIGQKTTDLCFSSKLLDNNHLENNADNRFTLNNEHIDNLRRLLTLNKVEEVRLVYLKNNYDLNNILEVIQKELRNYPEVIFKLIRMHTRGLPKERLLLLKGTIPSKSEFNKVVETVKSRNFNKLITID